MTRVPTNTSWTCDCATHRNFCVGGYYEVADVALMCGFVDHPTFTKAFKRRFGLAPSAWTSTLRRN